MKKKIYWAVTGLFSAMMLFSATMYFVQNDMVTEMFQKLGFPTFIIYPLAVAKILGVVAIVSNKSQTLKEWAYAGFFFDLVLAAAAHLNIGDGQFAPPLIVLILVIASYVLGREVRTADQV